jgi:hypothetical protein
MAEREYRPARSMIAAGMIETWNEALHQPVVAEILQSEMRSIWMPPNTVTPVDSPRSVARLIRSTCSPDLGLGSL